MKIITLYAKCSDLFSASLTVDGKDVGEYDGYVPKIIPNDFGDAVYLKIDVDTGKILNWQVPMDEQLNETFKTEKEEE